MAEREVRERDILVAANEYAYVQDLTKGDIVLYVGPTKISLSNTERLVEYRGDRFVPARGDESCGVHPFVAATSAQYIALENPPRDPGVRSVKGSNSAIELLVGRRVVVPGPASFPLWPGQRAQVVDGHRLREDEYLVVRVYDVLEDDPRPIGSERIVRGADLSFYIPTTGLEVVPHAGGFVRRARRLRKGTGLHLRVVKPFEVAEGEQLPPGRYEAGRDLFLADREGYFFPTEALEVVGEVQAIPLAEKEGLYVRELATGRVSTVAGPCNYLPDPTQVEIASRPLTAELTALYGVPQPPVGRALAVQVPPSHAVLVTARNRREVVKGPQTRLLDFDEELEVLRLSTGRPKCDEELLATCFLQTDGNKVSDMVRLRTSDHVEIEVTLSYRVSFVTRDATAERWFHVKNYVALLCDHLASLLRAAARTATIEDFHARSTELVRVAILGDKGPDGKRPGRLFEENDLCVYDVEVLDAQILDEAVRTLLAEAQRTAITHEVGKRHKELEKEERELEERVKREVLIAQAATCRQAMELEAAERELALARAGSADQVARLTRTGQARVQAEALGIEAAARHEAEARAQELERAALEAKVAAFREQMAALQPELVATLKTLGNQALAGELTRNLAPLSILGGESVLEVARRLLGALPLGAEGAPASEVLARGPNGKGAGEARPRK